MSLFDKGSSSLPQQRRRWLPPSAGGAGSVGTSDGTSTADAASVPLGVGASAGVGAAIGVGAPLASGAGAATGTSTAAAAAPSSNIFPLTIESGGRYLKRNDGQPFLLCADTTWSLAVDIPLADINTFLGTITGQGFNAVSMNVIEHHYTTVKPPKERGGNLPFTKRLDGASFTGSPNGTTGAAGTQGQFSGDNYSSISTQAPDPTFPGGTYWQAVETILDACLSHNVAVFAWVGYLGFHNNDEGWLNEMVVWDGIIGAGGFTGAPFANATKSKMWNYGAWLGDRWKNYPHIVWVMGGDYGSGSQTLNTAQAAAVSNLMAGLKSVAGQQSTFFTAHWDRISIATDTVLAAGSFDLNAGYCGEEVAETLRRAYAHSPVSPAIVLEYFYENDLFGGSAPYRKYMYWGFLGGIAGGFFGEEQVWRFDDGTPGTDYTTLLHTQGTLDAQRQFTFWNARQWWRLKPSGLGGMGTIITAGGGTASPQSTTYVAAAATSEGDLLLAYLPPDHTGSVTVDMTKMSAMAQARWFDPTNAAFTNAGAFANTGTHAFTTPGNNNAGDPDWLLVLETVAGSATAGGTAAAVGASTAAAAGTAAGAGAAAAVAAATIAGVGAAAGTSTALGSSTTVLAGAGASAGASTASSVAAPLAAGIGTSAGLATATAAPGFTGISAGIAIATAVGRALASSVAASSGIGTATGVAAALSAGVGASAGSATATATGAGPSASQGTGAAAGSSTAAATGLALASGIGAAAGLSTAVAASATVAATGAGAGSAAAAAVGRSLWAATGTAAGSSVVAGFYTSVIVELTGFSAMVAAMDDLIIDLLE